MLPNKGIKHHDQFVVTFDHYISNISEFVICPYFTKFLRFIRLGFGYAIFIGIFANRSSVILFKALAFFFFFFFENTASWCKGANAYVPPGLQIN